MMRASGRRYFAQHAKHGTASAVHQTFRPEYK